MTWECSESGGVSHQPNPSPVKPASSSRQAPTRSEEQRHLAVADHRKHRDQHFQARAAAMHAHTSRLHLRQADGDVLVLEIKNHGGLVRCEDHLISHILVLQPCLVGNGLLTCSSIFTPLPLQIYPSLFCCERSSDPASVQRGPASIPSRPPVLL